MVDNGELFLQDEKGFFKQVTNFEDYKNRLGLLLKACKTREHLEAVKPVIEEVKTRLMETNPEFRDIMDQRKQEAKMKSEQDQALHRAKMAENEVETSRIRNEALAKIKNSDVENWVSQTKIKTYDPDEKQKEIDAGLWCPICRTEDKKGNTVNNKPTCMACWHPLVFQDNLKDYPRKYRRAWKKRS